MGRAGGAPGGLTWFAAFLEHLLGEWFVSAIAAAPEPGLSTPHSDRGLQATKRYVFWFSRKGPRACESVAGYCYLWLYVYSSAGFVSSDSKLLIMLMCFCEPRF